MASSRDVVAVAPDKTVLSQLLQADTNAQFTLKPPVQRIATTAKQIGASLRVYEDLESDSAREPIESALEGTLKEFEAFLYERAATRIAISDLHTKASADRTAMAPVPDFSFFLSKLIAQSGSSGKAAVKRDNPVAFGAIQEVRATLKSQDREVEALGAVGGKDSKFTCELTKRAMVNPMRTPCNHVFSEEGLRMVAGKGPTFRCPKHACTRPPLRWSDLVRDEAMEDEIDMFTQARAAEAEAMGGEGEGGAQDEGFQDAEEEEEVRRPTKKGRPGK